MNRATRKSFLKSAAVLLVLGLIPAFVFRSTHDVAPLVFLSDVLFSEASVFLLWGLVRLLGNAHMFTSSAWGFRSIRKLVQGRQDNADTMKEDYLQYRKNRPRHEDVKPLLISAAVLMVLSVLVSLLVM